MNDCRKMIYSMFAARKSIQNPTGQPWHTVAQKLTTLNETCWSTFMSHVEVIINDISAAEDEGEVLVELAALLIRDQEAATRLAIAALQNHNTVIKEDYALALEKCGFRDKSISVLCEILAEDGGRNLRPDLSSVIRVLHTLQAKEAAYLVRPFIEMQDDNIRGEAIGFLYDCDGPASADAFLAQLKKEKDHEFASLMIDALVMWGFDFELERFSNRPNLEPGVRELINAARQ